MVEVYSKTEKGFTALHILIPTFLVLVLHSWLSNSLINTQTWFKDVLHSMSSAPFQIPSVDENSYRLLQLDNGMTCLIVSDVNTEKAAAAVDVRVGSLSDPVDVPGLAHFLEHMLFYSSEKYPVEDEYSKWIAEHGGHTNAYTSNESTNYHFDVSSDNLDEALDRFAQFFICPLISEDGVDREANAVDSENGKNLNSDPWKKLQLWKHTANTTHPFSRFSTGNLETLITKPKAAGENVHDRVKQFYEEHYSSNLMKLAVLGKESLDELENMVRSKFAAVQKRPGIDAPARFEPDAVTSEHQGLLIKVVPERHGHSVELQWPTIPEQENYRAAPSHYVSHLLGHEGEGSAFAYLKSLGWATGLVAGEASTSFSARSFFMCRVDLTDAGHAHVDQVVEIIFRYLDIIRAPGGVNETTWQEMRALADIKFNYRDKLNPYSYVSSLTHAMQVYAPEDLLKAVYNVPFEYNPELIKAVLDDLTPTKARVMWSSKALEADCTDEEPWYGTKHSVSRIPNDWMQSWLHGEQPKELHLPDANPFIPSDFSLLKESSPEPTLILNDEMVSLWHRPEPSFKVPKAVLFLHFQLPESYVSPEAAVMTSLFTKLVNDELSEVSYPAELAGLHYGIRSTVPGMLISATGYHHTLPKLAQVVLDAALSYNVKEDRFAVIKEKLAKDYANMKFEQPYSVALYNLALLTEATRWHVDDYQAVLPGITADALQTFIKTRLLKRCPVEAYVAGNLSPDHTIEFLTSLKEQLKTRCGCQPPLASQKVQQRIVKPQPGRPVVWNQSGPNPSNENSAVAAIFQCGADSAKLNALTELVTHIGKRDAFYQLRTVEQLGYITSCTAYWTLTVRNIAFIVQSSVKGAEYLLSRVEAFLPMLAERLEAMPADEFNAQVDELAKSKLEKPKRLREAAGKDWREIEDGSLRFARQAEEVEVLRSLTQSEVVEFYKELVLNVETRRKIVILIEGNKAVVTDDGGVKEEMVVDGGSTSIEENAEIVTDAFAWKRAQELYPATK